MPLPLVNDGSRVARMICRAVFGFVLFSGGCTCSNDPVYGETGLPEAPAASSLVAARMEILPGNVAAIANAPFEMRVRLWNAAGNVLPEASGAEVQWTITGSPTSATATTVGARTLVTILTEVGTPYKLTAVEPNSGLTKTINIDAVKFEVPLTTDWIAGPLDAKSPPMIALVDGDWSPFAEDKLFGFVGAGSLGAIKSGCPSDIAIPCGEITLFSTMRGLDRAPRFSWTHTNCDTGDRRDSALPPSGCNPVSSGALAGLRSVNMNVWILTALATPFDVAPHVGGIKKTLTDSWAGLSLNETIHDFGGNSELSMDVDLSTGQCGPQTKSNLQALGVAGFGINTITLVIVQGINYLDSGGWPVNSGWLGYTCPHAGTTGTIAVVDWSQSHETTLEHEVGHALGPWNQVDDWGHAEFISGLSYSNLMYSWHDYTAPAARTTLTLGQVFRFSLDRDALMHRGPPSGLDRCAQTALAMRPCPAITKDVP